MEKLELSRTAGRNVKWKTVSKFPPLRHTAKTYVHAKTCTRVLGAALFITASKWKHQKCPLTNKWIIKMWYSHTMEYYSDIKE